MSPPAGLPPNPMRLTRGPDPIPMPARAAAASKRSRSPGPPPATRTEPGTSGPLQGPETTVTADDDTWADLFSRVLVARIEPHLGLGRPTILCEYPVSEAALARPSPRDPRVAERFELFVCGIELANAFVELTDAAEQRRRFEAEMDEKQRIYGERYPLDEDFLAALAQMPDASGIALGFDRLVMLATGAARIDDVQWTPVP